MAHSSLQVCMDSSDWLHQGTMTMSEELSTGLDSSSPSPSGGGGTTTECMLAAACSSRAGPPLMERRLRPPHDQHLKCPRCDSTHTKFCYYNNYSLSQPRYFCKTCRRYWTKGGTLRNIPVGGGCRKNKKPTYSKKSNNNNNTTTSGGGGGGGDPLNHHINHQSPIMMMPNHLGSPSSTPNNHPIDLHLSFPHEVQFPPHLAHLIGAQMSLGGVIGGAGAGGGGGSFMGLEGGSLIRPIDFMESTYEGFMGGVSRGHDFMGSNGNGNGNGNNGNNNNNENDQFGLMGGIDGDCYNNGTSIGGGINYSSNSLFGVPTNTNATTSHDIISFMDQRLLLPYDHLNHDHHHHHHHEHDHDHDHHHHQSGLVDVKPNPKLLSLEWQDQGCTTTTTTTTPTTNTISDHHNSGSNALNSWTGFLGSFQSPTTNPLV